MKRIIRIFALAILGILTIVMLFPRIAIFFHKEQKEYASAANKATKNKSWISFDLIEDYYSNDKSDGASLFHICYHFNGNKSELFLSYLNESRIFKMDNNSIYSINYANQIIIESKKLFSINNSYLSTRNDIEAKFQFLPYYTESLPYIMRSSQWQLQINQCLDTVIHNNKKLLFIGKTKKRFLQNQSNGNYTIPLQYQCQTWINAETYQVDSVIAVNIANNCFNQKIIYKIENLNFADHSSYYDSIFDINSSYYSDFTKYLGNDLPIHRPRTDEIELDSSNLTYPIISLDKDTTNLSMRSGWVLLDLWMFGCGGCENCFDTFKKENDSIGCRILENESITIMSVNALSDNMDMINAYASKFDMEDIMYFSKGFSTNLALVNFSYPSYYLISPEKNIVWRSNYLGDYSELLEAKANYEKQH